MTKLEAKASGAAIRACGIAARENGGQVDVGAQRQEAEELGRTLEVDLLRPLPLLLFVS
jgi:hypothetical protein